VQAPDRLRSYRRVLVQLLAEAERKVERRLDTTPVHGRQSELEPGMLTQGAQGGRPAPLASRLHRIPIHFLLNLHGIQWKLSTFGPPD
jgi:hypothetical protein